MPNFDRQGDYPPAPGRPSDVIRVNSLLLIVELNDYVKTSFRRVELTLEVEHDVRLTALTDDVAHTINYSTLCGTATKWASSRAYASLEDLADQLISAIRVEHANVNLLTVCVSTKGPVFGKAIGLKRFWCRDVSSTLLKDRPTSTYFLEDWTCDAIIGIHPHERVNRQRLKLNILVERRFGAPIKSSTFNFRAFSQMLYNHFRDDAAAGYFTLEKAASRAAELALSFTECTYDTVVIKAAKPDAIPLANSSEVEVRRTLADYPSDSAELWMDADAVPERPEQCAIALGSNLGDKFANIEVALRLLERPKDLLSDVLTDSFVSVVDTSFMYETAPMYVVDQPSFINCACMIETNLTPRTLLRLLKEIEKVVGRVPSVRNGPRAVDLDIVTFGANLIDTRLPESRNGLGDLEGHLIVPHPRLAEREFVLRPLDDMIPSFVHPRLLQSISQLLAQVMTACSSDAPPMRKVLPFPRYPLDPKETWSISGTQWIPTATHWTLPPVNSQTYGTPQRAYIMATLNATPDSFSDGSLNNNISSAIAYANSSVTAGADIIDIGGYSTRPGATFVTPEDEIERVVPIVRALRRQRTSSSITTRELLISVDTFRPDVAQAAVLAGANCINDVYGFAGPDYPPTETSGRYVAQMREVARQLGIPVVLMHSRGDAGQNKDYSAYPGGVIDGVVHELSARVDAVVKGLGGVRRWLVLLDPGIGFSKTVKDNLQLLRCASMLTTQSASWMNPLQGFPQLIGTSRKSFLGKLLERDDQAGTYIGRETAANERDWATAAAVTTAILEGAAVVRVHNVVELGDVVRISSAIRG